MTRLSISALLCPFLLCLACAAQQPASPPATSAAAPAATASPAAAQTVSQAEPAPPAPSPAEQAVAEARAHLAEVESAHKGNTLDLAKALFDLISAEEDVDKPTPEMLDLAKRELSVAEAAAGKNSKAYIDALSDNAETRVHLNRLAEARPFAEQAVEIATANFPTSQQRIDATETLAFVCVNLGDLLCTRRAYEENIELERKLGPEHAWDLAYSLANYSDLLSRLPGQDAATGAAAQEAFDIARRIKPDDIHIGLFENNVAMHYVHTQEFQKAIDHFNSLIPRLVRDYGQDSPLVRVAYGNLAQIYTRTGQFDLAWKTYATTLNNPGETYDAQALNHAFFARSLAAGGQPGNAIHEGLLSSRMRRESFALQARTLPERQALAYERSSPHGLDTALSVLARHPGLPANDTYEEMVRSRALVADEMARRQRNLNASNDPETATLLAELNRARADLLAIERKPQDKAESSPAVLAATDRMEKLERQLAERSADVREEEAAFAAGIDDLRRVLPPHTALVSYWAFGRRAVEKVDPAYTEDPSYIAFILTPDKPTARIVDLGQAKPIEDAISRMRASANNEAHSGGLGSARNERAYRAAGTDLRKLVWDPLQPGLGDAHAIIVVPDGMLNLVPFASLPDGAGYLVERSRTIETISSERDLLAPPQATHGSGLLAIGSPQFDLADSAPPARLRDAAIPCDAFEKVEFGALRGAAVELRDIGSTWHRLNPREPVALIAGNQATRERFLDAAPQSRVLHVATHAFLLDHSCGDGNPLLHSGLVFAGANRNRSASILTAQQIASLDLSGVDWAVLSACNTGAGELRDGEGVLGLERAFRIAGVRSVVMTLWPVDDQVTARFMHHLYTQRLVHRDKVGDAAWQSSRNLLEQRRAAGKTTHPWYWAGFVASGWEPAR